MSGPPASSSQSSVTEFSDRPPCRSGGHTPLLAAAREGHHEVVQLLCEKRVDQVGRSAAPEWIGDQGRRAGRGAGRRAGGV